jgi:hypothetical protein
MIVRQGRQHSIIQKLLGQQSFFRLKPSCLNYRDCVK